MSMIPGGEIHVPDSIIVGVDVALVDMETW